MLALNKKIIAKYIAKNDIQDIKIFNRGYNDANNIELYKYVKGLKTLNSYELGFVLHLVVEYLLNEEKINLTSKKDTNNFIEKVTSINLEAYIESIKKTKKMVKPIVMNAITIKTSEKYLRQKSQKVNMDDQNLKDDITVLEDYCIEGNVLAMAAIQLGIPKRIIYLKNTNLELVNKFQAQKTEDINEYNEKRILINPKILKQKGITEYWEACASCLDNMGHVYRPYEIELEYFDLKNIKHIATFRGFECTVLAHEYDHLNGVLHMDRADKILIMKPEDRKKYRQNHKYTVICTKGKYQTLLKKVVEKW